jgi:hypothetical protein
MKTIIKTIFWEVNGERRVFDEEEYEKYRKYVESDEKKCNYIGYTKTNDFGSFDIEVCAGILDDKIVIYIVKDWVPQIGYSWSESEIKKIEVG